MTTLNNFRTQVNTSISINRISHDNHIVFMGSCFSDSMMKYFSNYCFSVFNPYGTIYNPITLSQNIKRAMTENMFSEAELLQNEEVIKISNDMIKLKSLKNDIILILQSNGIQM